jgi:uncharacterized RDD family membrane protein YckC
MTAAVAARPAGFWRRYGAYSLDFTMLAAAALALGWPHLLAAWRDTVAATHALSALLGRSLADGLTHGMSPDGLAHALLADPRVVAGADAVHGGIVRLLCSWVPWYALLSTLYHVGFERSPWRGSPGKRALQLEVVDATDDGTPAAWRTLLRHAACTLSWLTLNLGHALAALPPQKRALHDYIAGTRVLDGSVGAQLPAWARLWLLAQAAAAVALMAWGLQRYAMALQSAVAG